MLRSWLSRKEATRLFSLSPFTRPEERDGLSTVLSALAGTGKAELSF